MVMMATKGPIVAMVDGSVGGDEGLIRTRAVLPTARLSRSRRMAVTGVSALLNSMAGDQVQAGQVLWVPHG